MTNPAVVTSFSDEEPTRIKGVGHRRTRERISRSRWIAPMLSHCQTRV